jgi:hypothetical protein
MKRLALIGATLDEARVIHGGDSFPHFLANHKYVDS